MTQKTAEDFLRTHTRRRLGEDGRPAMTERYVDHLEAAVRQAEPDVAPAISLDAALARLIDEHPRYARPVVLCELRGLDERTVARLLRTAHSRVNRNKWEGLSKLAQWTGLDVAEVRAALRGASSCGILLQSPSRPS